MQHHGAPTRLLDWTYSILVAAYFALEYAMQDLGSSATVWVLNATWATQETVRLFRRADRPDAAKYVGTEFKGPEHEPRFEHTFFAPNPVLCVCPENPFRLNERLTIQRGVFVCVGNARRSFEDNIRRLRGHTLRENLRRITIPSDCVPAMLNELYQANITQATLFPGLDGFARSLKVNLASVPRVRDLW
jgi:hypothetical protein